MAKNKNNTVKLTSRFNAFTRVMAAFTASLFLVSSNLAYAAEPHQLGGAGQSKLNSSPMFEGLSRREIRQQIRQERNNGIGIPERGMRLDNINNGVNPRPTLTNPIMPNNNRGLNRGPSARNNEPRIPRSHTVRNNRHVFQQQESGRVIKLDNGANLDLTSTARNITLGDKLFADAGMVTITVGGETKTLYAGSQVTAAEYVAAKQALSGGAQKLTVGSDGQATGGTVDLNAIAATRDTMKANSLKVAEGVTAVGDFAKQSGFRLAGDLDNAGSVIAVASKNGRHAGEVRADNILNQEGALISSNAGSAHGNKANRIDLTVTADNNLTNLGTIESSGDLNLNAGGTITNAGTASSVAGDITLDNPVGELNVNNTNGTLQALEGSVNVRAPNYSGSHNSNVTGGDVVSQNLNMFTGQGMTEVHVDNLTGQVNGAGYGAHVSANTDNLVIGKICMTGDPTFTNNAGNITIIADQTVNEALAYLASGDIIFDTAAAGQDIDITAVDGAGNGRDITFTAGFTTTGGGATFPAQATTPVNVDSAGAGGGSILTTGPNTVNINAAATSGFDGGDVTLVARRAGAVGGQIQLPTDSLITTAGNPVGGLNGNIVVMGGANVPNAIQLGNLDAGGGANTFGGSITVRNNNPVTSVGGVTFAINGEIASGSFSAGGAQANGGILIGNGLVGSFINAGQGITVDAGLGGAILNVQQIDSRNADVSVTATGNATLQNTATVETNGFNLSVSSTTANARLLAGAPAAIDTRINGLGGGSVSFNSGAAGVAVANASINSGTGDVSVVGGTGALVGAAVNTNGGDVLVTTLAGNLTTDTITTNGGMATLSGGIIMAGNINTAGGAGGDVSVSGTGLNSLQGITTGGGDITVNGGGSINVAGDLDASNGGLGGVITLDTSATNLNITFTNAPTTISGQELILNAGTGSVLIPTLSSFNVNELDLMSNVVVGGGAGELTIAALTDGTPIGVGGAGGGTLSISQTELDFISAATLTIGNLALTSDITLFGALDVSGLGAGNYNLNFFSAGNYDQDGFTITLGSRNGNLQLAEMQLADIDSTTGDITVVASGNSLGFFAGAEITTTTGNVSLTSNGAIGTGIFSITSTSGDIDINANGGNILTGDLTTGGAGTIDLFANGPNSFIVTGELTTTGGAISLASNESITTDDINIGGGILTLSTLVDITTGDINNLGNAAGLVLNVSGDIEVGDVTVTGAAQDIILTAGDDVSTGDLETTGPGRVITLGAGGLNPGGGDLDTGDLTTANGAISLTASDDLSTGDIDTNGNTLTIAGTLNDVDLGDVAGISNDLVVNATGDISVGEVLLSAAGQDIMLTTTGGSIDVFGALQATGAGGVISLIADDTVDTFGNDLVTTSGNVTITGTNGDVFVDDIDTGSGSIFLTAGNDVAFDDLTSNAGGSLTVMAGNTIDLQGPNGTVTLTGGNGSISLTSVNGDVLLSDLSVVGAGTITVDAGDFIFGNVFGAVLTTDSGDVTLTAAGGVGVLDVTSNSGSISITANGANILVNNLSTGGLGTIDLQAQTDIDTGNLTTASGDISVTSTTGDISVLDINTGSGNVTLNADDDTTTANITSTLGGNIQIDSGGDTDGTGGLYSVVGAGTILVTSGGNNTDFSGSSVNGVITVVSTGGDNDFSTNTFNSVDGFITLISAAGDTSYNDMTSTGIGDITIFAQGSALGFANGADLTTNSGNITVVSAGGIGTGIFSATSTGGGDITVVANGAGANTLFVDLNTSAQITVFANQSVASGGNPSTVTGGTGPISITAQNGDVLLAAGASSISSTSGNITITAGDELFADDVTSTSGNIALTANGGDVDVLDVTTGGAGTITINANDEVITDALTTDAGNIDVTSGTLMNIFENITTGAGNVNLQSGGAALLADVLSTSGNIDVDSGDDIVAGDLSTSGNINLISVSDTTINDAAITTGTFTANTGDDFTSTGSITGTTGDVLVNSGIDINVNNIILTGAGSDIVLHAGNDINTTGVIQADPIVMTSANDINLGGNVVADDGILIVAGQTVRSTVAGIAINGTKSGAGDAGDITIVAGANFTVNANDVTINGGSATGGNINFFTNAISGINANKTTSNGAGGDVNLIAFNSGAVGGRVLLGTGSTIRTTGFNGDSGNVTAVGANNSGNFSVVLGNVITSTATAGNSGTGDVTVFSTLAQGGVTVDTTTSVGTVSGAFTGGPVLNNDIATGNITAAGADVAVFSGNDVVLGLVNVSGGAGAGANGGTIAIEMTGSTMLDIGVVSANSILGLTANGGPTSGDGGAILIQNNGGMGINLATSINANGTGNGLRDGGLVLLDATTGILNFNPGAAINVNASGNGEGGDIILLGTSVNVGAVNLILNANGSGTGAGGGVVIDATGPAAAPITIGTANGQIDINTFGTPGSLIFIDNANDINVAATGFLSATDIDLIASTGNINVAAGALVAGGNSVELDATAGGGTITVDGTVAGGNFLGAVADLNITGAGLLTGTNMFLNSANGSIQGTVGGLDIDATDLIVNAPLGAIDLDEQSSVNIVGASASNGLFQIDANGDITSSVGGTISGPGAVVLNAGGLLNFNANVTSASGPVTLSSVGDMTNAAGTVVTSGTTMDLFSSNGNIGTSPASRFNISVGSTLDADAPNGSIFIDAAGNLTTDASPTVASGVINIRSAGDFTTNGAFTANTIILRAISGQFNMMAGTTLNAANRIFLRSNLSILDANINNIVLTSNQVDLQSDSGSVGTAGAGGEIDVNAANVTANAATDVFILENNNSGLNIGAGASTAGNTFSVAAGGPLSNNGTINANDVVLTSTTAGITNNALVTGANSVTLNANTSIVSVNNIVTDTLSLNSTTGNIGVAGNRVVFDAVNVTANAGNGSVFLRDTANGINVLNNSNAGNDWNLVAAGAGGFLSTSAAISSTNGNVELRSNQENVAIDGTLTANNGNITVESQNALTTTGTSAINAGGTVSLDSIAGSITINDDVNATNIFVTADNNVSTGVGAPLSGNVVDIEAINGALSLGANVNGTTSVTLTSDANIVQTSFTTITSNQINLNSTGGSIGTDAGAGRLNIDATNLTLNAFTDVFVGDPNSVNLGPGKSSANGTFDVTSGGTLTVTGGIDPAIVVLTSVNDIVLNSAVVATVSITANAGDNIINNAGGSLDAPTMSLNATTGSIGSLGSRVQIVTAGTTDVTANADDDVFLNGTDALNFAGASSADNGDFDVIAANNLSSGVGAGIFAGDDLDLLSTGGNMSFNAIVFALNDADLTAAGNITNAAGTFLDAGTASITSVNGNIGTGVVGRFNVDVQGGLDVHANNGSVFIHGAGDTTLNSSSALNQLDVDTDNNLIFATGATFTGAIQRYRAITGGLSLDTNTFTAIVSVDLRSNLAITDVNGSIFNTPQVNLISDTQEIDLTIDAQNLTANAGTFVNIVDPNSINIGGGTSSAGTDFFVEAGTSLTTTGDITAGGILDLEAGTSMTVGANLTSGNFISLDADGGDLTINGDANAGTHFFADGTNIVINGNVTSQNLMIIEATASLTANGDLSGGDLEIDADGGSATFNGTVTSTSGEISLFAQNNVTTNDLLNGATDVGIFALNGNINVNDDVNAGGEIDINALNGSVTTLTNGFLGAILNAGGDVEIDAGTSISIGNDVLGNNITMDAGTTLTTSAFANIGTAGTPANNVTLDSNGTMTINQGIEATGDIDFNVNGGGNLVLNAGVFDINAGGNVSGDAQNIFVNANVNAGLDVDFFANNNVTTTGDISGDVVTIEANNGSLTLNGNVTGQTVINLLSNNTISNTNFVSITAPQINLTSFNGNIGISAGNRLLIDADLLTANANNGSVFITDSDDLTLGVGGSNAGAANGIFDVMAAGNLDTTGAVSGDTVVLDAGNNMTIGNTINGDFVFLDAVNTFTSQNGVAPINGTQSVVIIGNDIVINDLVQSTAGSITLIGGNSLTTLGLAGPNNGGALDAFTFIGAEADTVNIGADVSTIIGNIDIIAFTGNLTTGLFSDIDSGNNLVLDAVNGSVNVTPGGISGLTADNDIIILAGTNITINNSANGVDAGNNLIINADNNVNIDNAVGAANDVDVFAGNDVNSTTNGSITGTNVDVEATNGALGLAGTTIGTTTLRLASFASITNANVTGVFGAPLLTLESFNGNIGTSAANRFNLDATTLRAIANNGSVFINDTTGGLDIGGGASSALLTFDVLSVGALSNSDTIGAGDVVLRAGGSLTVNADITAGVSALLRSNTSTIAVNAEVDGGAFAQVRSNGNMTTQAGTGLVIGTIVDLLSETGDIGTFGNRFQVEAGDLFANAPSGNIYINDATGLDVNTSSALGDMDIVSTGLLTVIGPIDANNVFLRSTNNTIQVNDFVTGFSSVTLRSRTGLFDANFFAVNAINSPVTSLTTDIGNIGSNVDALDLDLNAASFSAALGSIFFADPNNLTVNNVVSSALGSVEISANNNLTFNGTSTATDIVLAALLGNLDVNSNLTAFNSLTLAANGNVSTNAASLDAPFITLFSASGNVGSSGNFVQIVGGPTNLTASALNGSVFVNAAGTVTLLNDQGAFSDYELSAGGNIIFAAGTDLIGTNVTLTTGGVFNLGTGTVTALNTINMIADGSFIGGIAPNSLAATQINLTSINGSIGVNALTRLSIDADNLTANAFNGSVFIEDLDDVTLGAGTSFALQTFDVSALGNLTTTGDIDANDIALTSGGNMVLNSILDANNNVTLTSGGTLLQNGFNFIDAINLSVEFASGNTSLNTIIATLTTVNSAGGNLTVNEAGSVVLLSQNINDLTVNAGFLVGGSISTGDDVVVNGNLTLNTDNGNVGSVLFNDDVTAANINVDSSNTITQSAGTLFSAGNLDLEWNNGNVTLDTAVASLSAFSPVNDLTIDQTGNISLGVIVVNNFTLNVMSDIVVNSDLTMVNLNLNAGTGSIILNANVTGTNTITLSAFDTIVQNSGLVAGGDFTLNFANGPVTLDTNVDSLTTNASGQVLNINEANGITINGQDVLTLNLTAGILGNGDVDFGAPINVGVLTVNNLNGNIDLSDDITASGLAIFLVAGANTITQSFGIVDTASLTLGSNTGNIGPISTTNSAGPGNQFLQVISNADADITTFAAGSVTLISSSADDLTINAVNALNIITSGNTTVSGVLDLTTNELVNANDLTAAAIFVQSQPGSGLNIFGGTGTGSMTATAGQINLTATNGDLVFFNDQNFFGTANLNGTPFEDIVISTGANVIGDSVINLNTCSLILQGTLFAPIINFNCPTGGGTIANSTGDVNLLGNIVFNGLNFAIIASGNINAGAATLIDLSNAGGDAGSLTLIAGYDFTPNTGGQLNNTPILFTLGAPSVTGGNINLGGVFIDVSSTGGNAGNVLAIASGNLSNNGDVNLGFIDASSSAGNGGLVQVVAGNQSAIANSNITLNGVDATGTANDGGLIVTNAVPVVSTGAGNEVFVANGDVFGPGTIGFGAPADGNITLNGFYDFGTTGGAILSGANSAANAINQFGTLIGDEVIINSGLGDVNLNNTFVTNFDITSQGDVFVNNTASTTQVNNLQGNQNLTINVDGNVNFNSNVNINSLFVNQLGVSGSILFGGTVTTSGNLVATNFGTGNISNTGNLTSTGGDIVLDTFFGNGSINIANNSNISAGGDVALLSSNAINVLGTHLVSGDELVLIFSNPAALTLTTDVNRVEANAGGNDLTINENNGIAVGSMANVNNLTVNAGQTAAGTLVVDINPLSVGNDLILTNADGDIDLGNNLLNAGDGIALIASGTILQGATGDIQSLDLFVQFGTGPVTLNTNVDSMSSSAAGQQLTINEGGSILLNSQNVDGLTVNAFGDIDTNAVISIVDLNLNAGGDVNVNNDIGGSNSVTLTSQTGTINQAALTTISGGALTVDFATGSPLTLTTDVASIATTNSLGQSLIINEANSIAIDTQVIDNLTINTGIGGDILTLNDFTVSTLNLNTGTDGDIFLSNNVTANTVANLTATGTGTIDQAVGANLITPTLNLVSDTGNIGTGPQALSFNNFGGPVDVTVTTNADAFLLGTAGIVQLGTSSANDLTVVTSGAGSLVVTGNQTIAATLSLNSNSIDLGANTLTATDAFFNGLSASDLSLTSNGSTVTAANLTTIAADGNVVLFGTQTYNGNVAINPSINNSVIVSANAVFTGNNTVDLNTCSLIIQGSGLSTGIITGNPLNFNCPNGAGTIANMAGDVTLLGDIIFNGQSVAILASGNINAGAATLIDLTGTTNGGSLLAVAGFDFTPGTGGVQVNLPNPQVYTLAQGGGNLTGGNIDFTGLNIVTDGLNGDAGDITLVANGGFTNNGVVTVGNLTAVGGNGFGGDVTVIAEGGFTTGVINNTGTAGAGLTNLAAAEPVIINGDILVLNGEQGGNGQFSTGVATGNGTIANSMGDVDLTGLNLTFTGLGLAIIASGDVLAGDVTQINLSNGAGDGGDLLVVAGFDFTPATPGQINFDSATTFTFTGPSTTGGNIDLTGVNITSNGGAGNGGDITLVAAAGSVSNGTITTGNITATGTGGTGGDVLVIAEGGFTVGSINNNGNLGNGTTTLAAAAPVITGGPITVNNGNQGGPGQFTFTAPTGAGTIANSTGDVLLGSDLIFVGLNLAIIAANDIIGTGITQINLSNGAGDAGNLTMIAGYDFTPGTGGQVTDNTTLFTVGSANTLGGNIDLTGVTITLVSSTGNGGNLLAVANGGTTSNGSITLGSVDTTGVTANGGVNIIGEGGITTGSIDTTGAAVGGDINLNVAQPVATGGAITLFNGNLGGPGFFSVGALGNGAISTGSLTSGDSIFLSANSAAGITVAANTAVNNVTVTNVGSVTVAGNQTATNGAISITSLDIAGTKNDLIINNGVALLAEDQIDLINTGTDKKPRQDADALLIGTNATLTTTSKVAGFGDINIRMGAVSAELNNNNLPKARFDVVEIGPGALHLFGRKPRGEKPINTLTAQGADINITLEKGFNARSLTFNGGVDVLADPPVAANATIYRNGKLVSGGDTESRNAQRGADREMLDMLVGTNNGNSNGIETSVLNQFEVPMTTNNVDTAMTVSSVTTTSTGNNGVAATTRTETLSGGVHVNTLEDNSYMVSSEGPTCAADAALCSDVELGLAAHGIKKMAHSNRVVLKSGNVLFAPFVDTVVETPQGNVVIQAKSVALVSAAADKLAVYDLDDAHKGSVSVEAHGQKLVLAPGSHLTVANEGEFAQVNAIEAIAHRNVATKAIKAGVKVHTSEFSIPSAVASVKPLVAVMNSKHAQAKKVADKLNKTTAIILTLGGSNGAYQHYFKPALTAMAK